jgi:hypothetical protein
MMRGAVPGSAKRSNSTTAMPSGLNASDEVYNSDDRHLDGPGAVTISLEAARQEM